MINVCRKCKRKFNIRRAAIGYTICMDKACEDAPPIRTVVPMHKSNYILSTNREDLKGINNKGGFYR